MHSLRADYAGFPEYAGQYRLESVLGSGGMGVVHLATSSSGLKLAVKVVHAQHAVDPEFRARFRQEVAAARRVSGAFTAPVVDADPDAERPWMATLFIDAPTLSERVRERVLDAVELTRLAAGLAEALRDIHRAGVVHRDLKPSNVLMAPDGVRVIDFGISRPADSDLRTETGKLIGTPPFMAPEQFQRPREVGTAADVFALGAVLVHAATGRGPFDSDSHYLVAYQVVHSEPDLTGLPARLVPIVARCLAKDPAQRPTAEALIAEIRTVTSPTAEDTQAYIPHPRRPVAEEEITHRRDQPAVAREEAPPKRGRRGRTVTAGALGLLLTAGAAGGYLWFGADARTARPAPEVSGVSATAGAPVSPWSVPLGGHTMSCSAEDAGLYCSGRGLAAARLDTANGSTAWAVRTNTPDQPGATAVTPLHAGGAVLVAAPGGEALQALDPRTGTERWRHKLPSGTHVVVAGPHVLLVAPNGSVTALDAANGTQRWTKRAEAGSGWWGGAQGQKGGPAFYTSTADDAGRSTRISEVDAASGAERWQVRAGGRLLPFGTARGCLYLLDTDPSAHVGGIVRIDLATRTIHRVQLSAPLYDAQATVEPNGTVYASGAQGAVVAVDTNKELWRLETGAASTSRPAFLDGRVYLSVSDGRLLAVDAAVGRLAGQTKARMATGQATISATLPAPVVSAGRVHASAPDGTVFAVDARNPAGW
ncbi:PQQ-binding-like beta-propeller repeat protein [Streptomyces sp. NBC_00249]|uniref:serine/threonine-protein kinase n=1 Tax=Streptomyces sp. NBC_00249 TaxID=2975690 RepID=UPI00225030E2|nr:serine/threonine-protein kinase [Streptomyces sp. NBC_00249]MCX5195812.1 PQQ-binding-like beta-propeller repeat protein [Streptomyces sp. NBC_00249]